MEIAASRAAARYGTDLRQSMKRRRSGALRSNHGPFIRFVSSRIVQANRRRPGNSGRSRLQDVIDSRRLLRASGWARCRA